MAIKNVVSPIGFDGIHYIVTDGFDIGGSGVLPNVGLGRLYIQYAFAGEAGLMEAAASAIAIEPIDGGLNLLP